MAADLKMMEQPIIVLSTLMILLAPVMLVSGQLSIPRRRLGFVYNTSSSTAAADRSDPVTLTAYMDVTCPDSKIAYSTLIQLADQLADANQNFELVFLSFSLPYHRNSHVITQAAHLINDIEGSDRVFPFITEVFEKLSTLTTRATSNMTDGDIINNLLVPIVFNSTGISGQDFKEKITKNSRKYDLASRLDFKYGCTRGVYGTPTFMVNDVLVNADSTWTVMQWKNLIEGLL